MIKLNGNSDTSWKLHGQNGNWKERNIHGRGDGPKLVLYSKEKGKKWDEWKQGKDNGLINGETRNKLTGGKETVKRKNLSTTWYKKINVKW